MNIFIVSTRLQYIISSYMVQTMEEFRIERNILVLNLQELIPCDKIEHFEKIIIVNPSIRGSVWNTYNRKKYREVIIDVEKTIGKCKNIQFFLPGIINLLDNVIYKYFIKYRDAFYCYLPEGNYSFYVQKMSFIDKIKMKIKESCGKFGWFPYESFKGDRLGIVLADKFYSFLPKFIDFFQEEIVEIPIYQKNNYRLALDTCVFLGQAIEYGMRNNWRSKMQETASFVSEYWKGKKLYYKPHPRERLDETFYIFKNCGFELLSSKETIEEIILEKKFASTVISYWSSALINLKILLGNSIECVSYKGIEFYDIKKSEAKKICEIYVALNVKYIK